MSLGFLLVLGLVGLGLVLDGRRRAARDAAHPDQATLAALARAGSDLAQLHEVEFFLYLPTEAAAARVAATLGSEDFETAVSRAAEGPEWLCLATRRMRPDQEAFERLRTRLSTLAGSEGGEYDGWGATVVERPAGPAPRA
jgi:regulator of RNase E activity RraB